MQPPNETPEDYRLAYLAALSALREKEALIVDLEKQRDKAFELFAIGDRERLRADFGAQEAYVFAESFSRHFASVLESRLNVAFEAHMKNHHKTGYETVDE